MVPLFEAQESVDLGLRFVHPNLEQARVDRFDPQGHAGRAHSTGLVLIEAPADPLLAHGRALKRAGWELVYDVIDDWSDPALGGEWYRPELEQELVTSADRVVASAPDLIRRVEAMGRTATLVPNAVNVSVFGVELPPRPADLPEAETIIGYHGSLYGEWLDWESVGRVAEANPQAIVAVIGDDKAARPAMPPNVRFLGLKSQTDLPAYVQRFDVGLVPFKMNDTTHAVSPLKAYEYLASGVPIAAPPLRALEGLDGAHLDPDLVSAVGACPRLRTPRSGPSPERALVGGPCSQDHWHRGRGGRILTCLHNRQAGGALEQLGEAGRQVRRIGVVVCRRS